MPDNALRNLIDTATGRRPADLVLKNGRIVNVVSNEIHDGDIALFGDRIAGIGNYQADLSGRQAARILDLKGRYVCPGFIDAHVHIESSLLAVPEFARIVVARGTTAVVADPHEFANVMGTEGISFILRTAKYAPIDVYVMLSSCIPASPFETGGTELNAEDLQPFLGNPWVLGLAEMMNYPGVIAAQEDALHKISMSNHRVVDGHAPGLTGKDLTAYAAAGIMSDHECITVDEAMEKLRQGLHIMIREGSQARNLKALLPLVTPATAGRFMFCTDDKKVEQLLEEGQIDYMVRTAIAEGINPILAVRMATYNTASYFGLYRTGAVLPGYRADLAILEDLKECRVTQVFRRGELVAEDGRCITPKHAMEDRAPLRSSIDTHWIEPEDFHIPAPDGCSDVNPPKIHVIEVLGTRIDTERSIEPATVRNGQFVADPARDIAKILVIERHRASGEIGRGFVRGFRFETGAIASSVAHDAHNLIVVGTNDDDMRAAVIHLIKLRGGFVVVRDGEVLADLPLPVAGLVSSESAESVNSRLHKVTAATHQLGCRLDHPFMALSFLSLSVIGKLKLTNQGLIDTELFRSIPLVVADA